MPFLPSGTGQPANEGFQRGWNMIMNLYGKKKIDEQAQQQQQQFDQRFGLQKQQFEQESKLKDARLKEFEIKDKDRQTELSARQKFVKAKRAGMLAGKWGKEDQLSAFRDYQMAVGELEESSFDPPKETPEQTADRAVNTAKRKKDYTESLEDIEVYHPTKGSQKVQRKDLDSVKADGWTQIKPIKEGMSNADLTKRALAGDKESVDILNDLHARALEKAEKTGLAAIEAKMSIIDIEGTARSVVDGREDFSQVKNTFGVAVQEAVRKQVLKYDPTFNFNKPRIKAKAIQGSLSAQHKQRGMMGSFVKNLNKQLDRVDTIMEDVIKRVGVRAIDLPKREFITKFVGSGHEKVLEAYMVEISNEIGKLSTGSAASVRELSTDAQERWAKIHDPNLSIKEMKIILEETQQMANMRLDSTDEEISETMKQLDNLRMKKGLPPKDGGSRFKIIRVK